METLDFRVSELERLLNNSIRVFVVSELDEKKRLIRAKSEGLETGWLPWPACNGRNYTRWRPLRKGQQVVIASVGGDLSLGFVIAEIYSDQIKPSISNPDIDVIEFEGGDYIRRDAATGKMSIKATGGVSIIGDVSVVGGIKSTGDQVAENVSQIKHIHKETAPHPYLKSGKPEN